MNVMLIDGASLIDTRISNSGEVLICRFVKNISERKDGNWEEKPNYFTVLLKGDLRSRFEKMGAKPGSTFWLIGNYDISVYTGSDGKSYLNHTVNPYDFGYSSGRIGQGFFDVIHNNVGLVSDVTVVNENFAYVDGLYDVGYGENKKTEKLRLLITGGVPAFVQKGKRVDIVGRLDITMNTVADGKTYANKSVYVKELAKAPFSPKKPENAAGTPAQQAAPAPVQQPMSSVDFSDFEEVSDGADFF